MSLLVEEEYSWCSRWTLWRMKVIELEEQSFGTFLVGQASHTSPNS